MWRWEKLSEGQPSLQHSTNLGFMAEWLDRSLCSEKRHIKACSEFAKKHLNESQTMRNKIIWSDETRIKLLSVMSSESHRSSPVVVLLVLPNFFHLYIKEVTVLLGTLNAAEIIF